MKSNGVKIAGRPGRKLVALPGHEARFAEITEKLADAEKIREAAKEHFRKADALVDRYRQELADEGAWVTDFS